jgi:hypothetical protein
MSGVRLAVPVPVTLRERCGGGAACWIVVGPQALTKSARTNSDASNRDLVVFILVSL